MSCVYSCPAGALSLEERFDGFSFPVLDSAKCINCNVCKKVCPNDTVDELVSPIIKTYALKHKDVEIRKNSSSGGAFTAISDLLMSRGYKVYGAVFDETYHYVSHIGSYKIEDRNRMRISKYVESSLAGVYPEIKKDLEAGEKVLFSGTPCQANGLRAFLKKRYDNLFVMDFSCHGLISPRVFSDYMDVLSNGSRISYFAFRDKTTHTWENSETPRIECEDKTNMHYLPYLYRIITRSLGFRPSCSNCKFAQNNRASDITVGDLWSVNWTCPEMKDDYGVSFAAANSEKGTKLINELSEFCDIIEVDRKKLVSSVEHLNFPSKSSSINNMFWKYYKSHSVDKTLEIYGGDSLYSKLRRKPFEIINTKLKK